MPAHVLCNGVPSSTPSGSLSQARTPLCDGSNRPWLALRNQSRALLASLLLCAAARHPQLHAPRALVSTRKLRVRPGLTNRMPCGASKGPQPAEAARGAGWADGRIWQDGQERGGQAADSSVFSAGPTAGPTTGAASLCASLAKPNGYSPP